MRRKNHQLQMNKQLPSNRNWSCKEDIACMKTHLLYGKKNFGQISRCCKVLATPNSTRNKLITPWTTFLISPGVWRSSLTYKQSIQEKLIGFEVQIGNALRKNQLENCENNTKTAFIFDAMYWCADFYFGSFCSKKRPARLSNDDIAEKHNL